MDYAAQESYFRQSASMGAACVLLLVALSAICLAFTYPLAFTGATVSGAFVVASLSNSASLIAFGLILIMLAVSLYYVPNYLHFTVNNQKAKHWIVKIRWRIAVAVLTCGAAFVPTRHGLLLYLASAGWIVVTTLVARQFDTPAVLPLHLLLSDLLLVYAICILGPLAEPTIVISLLAAVFHFSTVIWRDASWMVVAAFVLCGTLLILPFAILWLLAAMDATGFAVLGAVAFPAVFVVVVVSTLVLVHRARKKCKRNITVAIEELGSFTGYSRERIRELWATADNQLAANWQSSGVANKSPEEIAEWYRENSELYMFAISAYNLEYKRIKSNLKMLRYGTGSCLDYGAGNGELILELARRGHCAAYYDVDGVSKRFAQFRAARYGLTVQFASTKDELRRITDAAPFDTIYSFDVLEHIPDLASELGFLVSLLAPNGLLLFDVPAGATVNHPMHLDHALNVREHLLGIGMLEIPMRSWRIRKQKKYAFRKPSAVQPSQSTQPQPH